MLSPDVVIVSIGVAEDRLHEIASYLRLRKAKEKKVTWSRRWPPPPPKEPPYTYLTNIDPRGWVLFEREYGVLTRARTQMFRSGTALEFDSPIRFSNPGLTLLRVGGEPLAAYPRHPITAEMLMPNSRWVDQELEIATRTSAQYGYNIALPDLHNVIEALLTRGSLKYDVSDKGKLARALSAQVDLDELLTTGVPAAIRALTTPRSKHFLNQLRQLTGLEADIIEFGNQWGGRTERRFRGAAHVKAEAGRPAAEALERLAELRLAERGLVVRCDRCTLKQFVPLHEVGGQGRCPGCQAAQGYLKNGAQLEVNYRLNTLVDRASDQGAIPHLLAVAALARRADHTELLPGVVVRFDESAPREADLFGVSGGRIIAGEVKSSPTDFTASQIKRDMRLSADLQAGVHVMACLADLGRDAIAAAEAEATDAGLELVVLGPKDLALA